LGKKKFISFKELQSAKKYITVISKTYPKHRLKKTFQVSPNEDFKPIRKWWGS
jgi:hypothetical protein